MTEISSLGEFGLIRHLTSDINLQNSSSLLGVGDDCAVIDNHDKLTLVTSDLLLEGVHFDLTYVPLKHLGYKAATVNLSDIYAMNGQPRQMVVSIGLSKRFTVEDVEQIYDGIKLACSRHHTDIVGGDTTSSLTGLTLSLTCIGEAGRDEVVYRSGARDTDLVCVSGDLGAAYMGLQLLEREKRVFEQMSREHNTTATTAGDSQANNSGDGDNSFQPDFQGKEYLLERQLKPEARGDIILRLKESGVKPTSMIDISDGLSSELLHICHQSHVGCEIYEERLPIDYQTSLQAQEFDISPSTCALNGGEDYELLFTVALSDYEKVRDMEGVHIIGRIQKEEYGSVLVAKGGAEYPLTAQGWQHLK